MYCDVCIRVNLNANVVLSSGTTMFQEIGDRMTKNRRIHLHSRCDQDGCTTRETVPGADWRVYLVSLQIFSVSRLRRAGSMNLALSSSTGSVVVSTVLFNVAR